MTRILHISDLHRTPRNEVTNTVLLHSLRTDLARIDGGHQIDIIVASGDIVQGAVDGDPSALAAQYAEATEFLGALADQFLHGDRERLVLVPGNHDVSWAATKASMTVIDSPPDTRRQILRDLVANRSAVRWSWADLQFLRITDRAGYERRLEPFATFYGAFYRGRRAFPLDPARQVDVFDYAALNMTVVAFNSCYENDHCNVAGRINPDCIASAGAVLQRPNLRGRQRLAVWHHNTRGLPAESNYMDVRILENLIELGISLGLHGHHHRNDIIDEYSTAFAGRRITLVSAGSLCAGPDEMPTGERRSYNMLDLDPGGKCQLRVRHEKGSDPLAPLWGPCRIPASESDVFTLQLDQPQELLTTSVTTLAEVEEHIAKRDYPAALALLHGMDFGNGYVRLFRLTCYLETGAAAELAAEFFPPQGTAEICAVIQALWETRAFDRLAAMCVRRSLSRPEQPKLRFVT